LICLIFSFNFMFDLSWFSISVFNFFIVSSKSLIV
jgi:hypothetical protein